MDGKISPFDVKVSYVDERVFIFGVDTVGLQLVSSFQTNDDVKFISFDSLDDIVAWAYNLGYENGLKDKGGTNGA